MRLEPNSYYRFKGSRTWEPAWAQTKGLGLIEITETEGHSSKPSIYSMNEIDIKFIDNSLGSTPSTTTTNGDKA